MPVMEIAAVVDGVAMDIGVYYAEEMTNDEISNNEIMTNDRNSNDETRSSLAE